MAASAKSLQSMFDDLHNCCGRLCPEIRPSQMQSYSLLSLAAAEGEEVLDAVQERLQTTTAGACCTCGTGLTTDNGLDDEDMLLTRLDFISRECRLLQSGLTCDDCRQLLRPDRLVCALSSLPQDQQNGRATFLQLCAHLASVNGAPESVLSSPDATIAWGQEALSRAYALQVLASGLSGWKLVTHDGQVVVPGEDGSALKVLEACLVAKPSTPKPKAKKRKSLGSGGAAAATSGATSVTASQASPAWQRSSGKKAAGGQATASAAASMQPGTAGKTAGASVGAGAFGGKGQGRAGGQQQVGGKVKKAKKGKQ